MGFNIILYIFQLRKEEEIKRVSEEARENYIAQMISNIRNRKFKDTDITELSVIEPLEGKSYNDLLDLTHFLPRGTWGNHAAFHFFLSFTYKLISPQILCASYISLFFGLPLFL